MRAPTELDEKTQCGLALLIHHADDVCDLKGGSDCTKVVLSITQNCWLVYGLGVRGVPSKVIPIIRDNEPCVCGSGRK